MKDFDKGLIILTLFFFLGLACSSGSSLEIEDGKGSALVWSLPDAQCIQTAMLTTPSGLKIKQTRLADGCVPKAVE